MAYNGPIFRLTIMSDSCLLPAFDSTAAADITRRLFGLEGRLKLLDGERDLNFLVTTDRGKFVFKIANALESPAMLECQHLVFQRLADAQVFPLVATALTSVNGRLIETVCDAQGIEHCCRVLPFLEGRMMAEITDLKAQVLADLGQRLALLDIALQGFSHTGLERPLLWNMEQALNILESYKPLLASDAQRALIEHFENGFREHVLPVQAELRRAVIHNDAHRGNVLVDEDGLQVTSIIDFGDMVNSWLVVEPTIAATYAMLGQVDPLGSAQTLLRGYHQTLPLTTIEISLVFDLMCMRLCMSVCICAHQRRLEPDNEYLGIDEQECWDLLGELQSVDYRDACAMMLAACSPE
jgi:Ser/Thr protein kinase RdoA (MazF antagonist)